MVVVLICADGASGGPPGLDGAEVVMVDELCLEPRKLEGLVAGGERELVLALHREQANLGEVQATLRRCGFDPLAVGLVDLGAVGAPNELKASLVAALARSRVYPGALPEQVKLLAADRRSRRGFLSVGTPTYTGAPRIDPEICVAAFGCQICAINCPASALEWVEGNITYDPNTCVACGICVTACPTGAVENPVATPAAISAEIAAAIDSAADVGIRYRCREARYPGESGWHQVEVPCTGMLTVGWLLAPFALGAAAVDALTCSQGGCSLGNDERLTATLVDTALVMDEFGMNNGASIDLDRSRVRTGAELLSPGSTARVIATLAPSAVAVSLHVADVGSVTIDPNTCTACLMCAQICPAEALVGQETSQGVWLDFDPRLCVACGQCVARCPERERGAIELSRRFDLEDWALGRRELRRDTAPLCEVCGSPVAPASMLARIGSMLGAEHAATLDVVGRRCINCRGR